MTGHWRECATSPAQRSFRRTLENLSFNLTNCVSLRQKPPRSLTSLDRLDALYAGRLLCALKYHEESAA